MLEDEIRLAAADAVANRVGDADGFGGGDVAQAVDLGLEHFQFVSAVELGEKRAAIAVEPVRLVDAPAADRSRIGQAKRHPGGCGNLLNDLVPHRRLIGDLAANVFEQTGAAVLEQVEHCLESLRPAVVRVGHLGRG